MAVMRSALYSGSHLTPGRLLMLVLLFVVYCALDVVLYRLCGLVVRVLGYRSGGTGSIPGLTDFLKKKTVVGLERGPLSLVSTTEELLDRKVAAPA
jgi:hypothetical protein